MWGKSTPVIEKIIEKTLDVIDELVEDKDKKSELKNALSIAIAKIDAKEFEALIRSQKEIIISEIKGESWLQKNWRPGLMALFGLIIFNNYILNPYFSALFGIHIMIEIPPSMWNLLKIGVSGYIVSRGAEKGLKIWKDK